MSEMIPNTAPKAADDRLPSGAFRHYWLLIMLSLPGLAYAFFRITKGYGTDNDTYSMINTWQVMIADHAYRASRYQGNIVAEFVIGFFGSLGGAFLSNAVILACSVASAWFVAKWAELTYPERGLKASLIFIPVVCVAFTNAAFVIASSTSIDYNIALFFFTMGLLLRTLNFKVFAILAFAAAGGTRIQYMPLAAIILAHFAYQHRKHSRDFREILEDLVGLFLATGLFYVPVWIAHSLHLDFLSAAPPNQQGFFGLLYRFIYKMVVQVTGVLCLVPVGIGLYFERSKMRAVTPSDGMKAISFVTATITIYSTVLFFMIPVESGYFITAFVFWPLWLLMRGMKVSLSLLAAGQLAAGLATVDVLQIKHLSDQPCAPVVGLGAKVHFSIKKGPLIKDMEDIPSQGACEIHRMRIPINNPYGPFPPKLDLFGHQH